MRYTSTTNIDCPVCETEITVVGRVYSDLGGRETAPEYEVESVDVKVCPSCGADVEGTALDAVADNDEGPDEDDAPYDTIEEAEYDREDYFG